MVNIWLTARKRDRVDGEENMDAATRGGKQPSRAQRAWLARGLEQAGGKLPLFDAHGRPIDPRTIRACIAHGWAEKWFDNPLKRDWLVCRLTARGRGVARASPADFAQLIRNSSNVIVLPTKNRPIQPAP
jgi:hypothetical protein